MVDNFTSLKSLKVPQSLKKNFHQEKFPKKGNWKVVLGLLLSTAGLSLFLWQKDYIWQWWQQFSGPATYEIINPEIMDTQLQRITSNLHTTNDVVTGIRALIDPLQGVYGVYVESLKDGSTYGVNQDEQFTAASVNKVLIMAKTLQEIDKEKLHFEDEYRLQQKDIQDYGTGSMRYARLGTTYSYDQLLELSGKQSDNTANWVLALILGKNKVQAFVDSLGMDQTSITDNTTTPVEMGKFFSRIYEGQILPDHLRDKFYGYLTQTEFEDRIPSGTPNFIAVAHKIGSEIQVINDCGIIFDKKNPYVLCILSKEVQEAEALKVLPKISTLVWTYESKK